MLPAMTPSSRQAPAVGLPLAWRIFVVNAAVFAVGALALVLLPVTVSTRVIVEEAAIVLGGLAVLLLINQLLVRRSLAPLARVMRAMQRTSLLHHDETLVPSGPAEVHQLVAVYDDMVRRLQSERRESGRRALTAQENERRRIAQELHDEIGQSLTAVKLQLARLGRHAPAALEPDVRAAQDELDRSLGDVRRIALRLRPEALDDLGLVPALTALTTDFSNRTGLRITRTIDRDLPSLDMDGELVVFRVAQEGLTNVARHAAAKSVEVRLTRTGDGVRLVVADDGRGLGGAKPHTGIEGMRERAVLVGGDLSISEPAGGGVRVTLDVPAAEQRR